MKVAQVVLYAIFICAVLVAIAIPVTSLYNDVLGELLVDITNPILKVILSFLPIAIFIGIAFVFINIVRTGNNA